MLSILFSSGKFLSFYFLFAIRLHSKAACKYDCRRVLIACNGKEGKKSIRVSKEQICE